MKIGVHEIFRRLPFVIGWFSYCAILLTPVWLVRLADFWTLVRMVIIFFFLMYFLFHHRKRIWTTAGSEVGQGEEEPSVNGVLPLFTLLFLGYIAAQFYFVADLSHTQPERPATYRGIFLAISTLLGASGLWALLLDQGTNQWLTRLTQKLGTSVRATKSFSGVGLVAGVAAMWFILPGMGGQSDAFILLGMVLAYGLLGFSIFCHAPELFSAGKPLGFLTALPLVGLTALGIASLIGSIEVGEVLWIRRQAEILSEQGEVEISARRYYEAEKRNWAGLELAPLATYEGIVQNLKSDTGNYPLAAFFSERIISRTRSQFAPDRRYLAVRYLDLADTYVMAGQVTAARNAFSKSIRWGKNPLDILSFMSRYTPLEE